MVENQSDPSPKLDVVHLVLPSCELSNPKLPLIILKMKTQQYTQNKENWCTLKTCTYCIFLKPTIFFSDHCGL